jgi:hypothetical protein
MLFFRIPFLCFKPLRAAAFHLEIASHQFTALALFYMIFAQSTSMEELQWRLWLSACLSKSIQ